MVHLLLSIINKKKLFKRQAFQIVFFLLCLLASAQIVARGVNEIKPKQEKNTVSDSITNFEEAEDLWSSINFVEMQTRIKNSLGLSTTDAAVYWAYLQDQLFQDKINFLNGGYKSITIAGFSNYVASLTQSYIKQYAAFLPNKAAFELQQAEQNALNNTVQGVTPPCTNMGFTSGLTGWTVYRGTANSGSWTNGGTFPAPSGVTLGQATPPRVNVKSVGGTDPFIPSLSVTPGASYPNAVMIEDYLNGGYASEISQTFAVTAANSLLTYKYAIVLESPNHPHKENPYFTATLTVNGVAVSCVKYSSIADPTVPADIAGFIYAPNVHNPYYKHGDVIDVSSTVNLYYKNWTTVAIPLDKYIGQNATITFTTADCSPGGHRGYAYLWAECSSLSSISATNYICSPETTSFSAPAGFKNYQWTGPGIVGASNTSSIQLNKPGAYSLIITPQYDSSGGTAPCYDTLKFNVLEHCSPTPISEALCETVQGTGKTTGVNLNNYNTAITAYNSAAAVQGWYSGTPPSAGNKVATPTNITVSNGSKYYAVITYPTLGIGGDTAELDFVVNSQPVVTAGPAQTVCENNDVVTLNGSITIASGGTWTSSGTGTFANASLPVTTYTPSTTPVLSSDTAKGSVTLTLTSAANGACSPVSANTTITITKLPKVSAGGNQTVCSNKDTITLNGSYTNAAGVTGVVWTTSGSGKFGNKNKAVTTYTPSAADITAGTITLTLTTIADGKTSSCLPVSNSMTLTITPAPIVSAGASQSLCANNAVATLNGSVSAPFAGIWSAVAPASGTFKNSSQLNTTYTPSAADISAGKVTLTLTSGNNGNCTVVSNTTTLTFTSGPTLTVPARVNACNNDTTVNLTSSVTGATGVEWLDGSNIFSTTTNATFKPSTAEKNAGGVELLAITTGNGNCNADTGTVFVIFSSAPVVNAGIGGGLCTNNPSIKLNGTVTNTPNDTIWSGGTGTFSPNAHTLNATYTPSAAELSAGSVTLTLTAEKNQCLNVSSNVTYTISPNPIVSAGGNQSVCSNNPTVTLNGSISNATGGIWTTSSGAAGGTFANSTSLNTTYTPSATDISNKSVTLTLTSTGNGNCNPVTSQTIITFTPSPTVTATTTTPTVCANNSPVALSYSTTIASGGVWSSSGSGAFTPSNTAANATYTPSASDTTKGSVVLTLTSTGNGNCNAVSENINITITPSPKVSAGATQNICANNALVNLNGTFSGATGVLWSGGSGTFGSNTSASTTYNPTVAELLTSSITLTLTTTGNGLCNPVSSSAKINIIPAPGANAGSDQTLCGNATSIALNGAVINSPKGGIWSSSGTGNFSPSVSTLNATYNPSPADITLGKISLYLATTGNTSCKEESDTMVVTFTTVPSVNAGPNQTVCTNDFPVQLAGTGSPSTWSGGAGTFSPNKTTLNATYIPSAADSAAGSVTLKLTSIANGACPQVSSKVKITIPAGPLVNAGPDQKVCGNTNTVQLKGSVTNATGGSWTSSGTGTFNSNTSLNAIYTASAADISAGTVKLILAATGTTPCTTQRDTIVVTFTPIVTVNAGPSQTFCADVASIPLNGSATNATTTWTTSGSGTIAAANNVVTSYTPSKNDVTSGSVTLTLSTAVSGACPVFTSNVTFTFTPPPTVNAGANQTICSNATSVKLTGTVTVAAGQVWKTTGTGTFSPDSTALSPTYFLSAADTALSSITFTLKTTGNGTCNTYTSQSVVTITPKPHASAGSNQTICSDAAGVLLNGTATNSSSTLWTTSGSGTFNNASAPITTYVPSAADIKAGTVTLTLTASGNGSCSSPSVSAMLVTITPAPTVNAGNNLTICANNPVATLNGSVTVATGATWTGGAGTFNPNANALNATYTPSATEISAGSVTLTLTTTGNGQCNSKSAQVVITIAPSPVVSAGATNETICADSSYIALKGTVTGAAGGLWSTSGSGNFFTSPSLLNANYVPSAADIANGKVTLTLTSQGNGTCNAVSSNLAITITTAPTANAGANQTICADAANVQLNGTVTTATGGKWITSGSGTFAPNNTTLNAQYIPSATDKAAGSVTLTLTTTGNGTCKQVSSSIVITINPAPTVNAGPNQTICADASSISLNGTVTVASGGVWRTSGSGVFFPDTAALNATYEPSATDKTSGSVKLTLITTGNGLCNAVSSSMTLTITPKPIISAGGAQSICANNSIVSLHGSVTNAGGVSWATSGTGTFTPDPDTTILKYYPSPADISSGSVTLTITSQENGLCNAVTDKAIITITPAPTINAGTDTTVCAGANLPGIQLNGMVTVADSVIWATSGTGIFNPNANTNAAYYSFSPSDLASGKVTLTLTSKGNGNCIAVSSKRVITLTTPPSANAGTDQTICADVTNVKLNGTIAAATGGQWTSSGSGTFSPNNTTLNATYAPSASDITNGNLVLTLTTTGSGVCAADTSHMNLVITPLPIANAGTNQTICSSANSVILSGTATVPTSSDGKLNNGSSIVWTSSGTGTFSPNADTVNAVYTPSAADIAAGNVKLTLTVDYGTCHAVTSNMTVQITTAPTSNAGAPQTICANSSAILNGTITGATGATWTTASGTGTFSPNANTLNATFTPSAQQIKNGKATLTLTTTGSGICNAASSTVAVTITPEPTINAGSDLIVCLGIDSVPLNAGVTIATGGTWSTVGSASGSFSPNANSLTPYYHPSASDFAAGSIQLAITSTGNGTCNSVSDTMKLSFSPAPPISAGPKDTITVCTTNFPIQLNGSGNTGVWSGGLGKYTPDSSSLTATYTPTASEIAAGSVKLILKTISSGGCVPGKDSILIYFTPGPTALPGNDTTVCSNTTGISLKGKVTVATGGRWTTDGEGTFTPNDSTLNATYVPSASDITGGSVTLTLTTIDNGICQGVSKNMVISFDSLPTVNAGQNQLICANTTTVNLLGKATHASSVLWSGGNGGTFSNAASLSTTYSPTAQDVSNGSAKITLTVLSDGICNAVSSTMLIDFGSLPAAFVGNSDTTVCASVSSVPLIGIVTSATGGTWSTNGTGTFSPNANTLNTSYIPSAADTGAHSVTVTLTTTANGTCPQASTNKKINFSPVPTVTAGTNTTACATDNSFNITGSFTNATGVQWSTSGNGIFTSGATTTNATYQPSASDKSSGVTLSLSTIAGTCPSVFSNVLIGFVPAPTANAGGTQKICIDAKTVTLEGVVTNATGGVWSTPIGVTGVITNPNSLNATFAPSAADTTAHSVKLVFQTTGSGVCAPASDTMTISFTPAPIVHAGNAQTVCADTAYILLNGTMTVSKQGVWSSTGTGTFSPDDAQLSVKYYPSNADTAAHSVKFILTSTDNGTCIPQKDSVTVTIVPKPTVNPGTAQELCASVTTINLSGSVKGAPGLLWGTTGSGSILNPTSAAATYEPTAADKAAGEVNISLTSQGGLCKPVTSYVTYTFSPTPSASVDAGFNQSVCVDATSITLHGAVKYAGGGIWSLGSNGAGKKATGSFSPIDTLLTSNYIPSAADKTSGKVTLKLTSTHNGLCSAVSDSMSISFTPAPTIKLNSYSASVCGDTSGIALNGNAVTVAGGGAWTTSGTGEFTPDADQVNGITYIPSAQDIANQKVTLTIKTTDNGTCNARDTSITIKISPVPVVSAGGNQTVCANATAVTLTGSVKNSQAGNTNLWTTSGSGTFSNSSALTSSYTPSTADVTAGRISLTLTSSNNGQCKPEKNEIDISFTPLPIVDAGPDSTEICADVAKINLTGSVKNASGGIWSSHGTGVFTNSDSLTTVYTPSQKDITTGSVTLVLTSSSNGVCKSDSATTFVKITPKPVVTVSTSVSCIYNGGDTLTGTVANAAGGVWTSSGSGAFSPNETALNVVYYPSAADKTSGQVTLTLTSQGNGTCNAETAQLGLIVSPPPVANAGATKYICEDSSTTLTAVASNNVHYLWTALSGTITTSPDTLEYAKVAITHSPASIVLTVTDQKGCFSKDTVTVNPVKPVTFNMAKHYCFSDTLILDAYPDDSISSLAVYQWFQNGILLPNQNDSVLKVPSGGTFMVTYALGTCSFSTSTDVTDPPFIITKDQSIVCTNQDVNLSVNVTRTPGNSYSYAWSVGKTPLPGDTTNISAPTALGAHYYYVKVTDKLGCSSLDSTRVIGIPQPQFSLFTNNISGCQGTPIILNATATNVTNIDSLPTIYQWKENNVVLNATSATLPATTSGTYIVTLTIDQCSNGDTATVNINPTPIPSNTTIKFCFRPTASDTNFRPTDTIRVASGLNNSYQWFTHDGTMDYDTNASSLGIRYPGTYYAIITNAFNCSDTSSVQVTEVCQPQIFVPNIFAPGSTSDNGKNSKFYIQGNHFSKNDGFSLEVFNRWGEVIFKTNDPSPDAGWDGNFGGEPMPIGDYPCVITYKGDTQDFNKVFREKRSVFVLR